MKKTIAFLLAFLLCLNLVACGGDAPAKDEDENEENEYEALVDKYDELLTYMEEGNYEAAMAYVGALYDEQQANMPGTPEDADEVYETTMYALESYQEGYGYWVDELETSLSGNDLLAYIYEQLVQLGDYKDSEEYLARFTVLADVQLSVSSISMDNLGNQGSSRTSTYAYDYRGNLLYHRSRMDADYLTGYLTLGYRWDDIHYVYDDQGNLSQIEFGYFYTDSSSLDAVTTFTWEDGKVVSSNTQTASGNSYDTTYVYDDAGRISEITLVEGSNTTVTVYTYDDSGNLTQKVSTRYYNDDLSERYTWTYTLDASGNTSKMVEFHEYSYSTYYDEFYYSQENVHEYTCDSQGRFLTETITYGQTIYRDGSATNPSYTTAELTYTYGDYYFFE